MGNSITDTLYYCHNCCNIFENPLVEYYGRDMQNPMLSCPACGDEDISRTYRCESCGEWITGSYIKLNNGERYCDNCYRNVRMGDED